MKNIIFLRGLGISVLITGVLIFFSFINKSLLLVGILILLAYIISCVISFITASFLKNMEVNPIPIEDDEQEKNNIDE